MMRAMDAVEHAEMIPLETDEERSHREKILEERNRAGVPRTHRAACKKIESEANVPIHFCGEMNLICEECGAKHLKENGRKTRNFRNVAKRAETIIRKQNHGQVYHNTAAVGTTENPKYADLYFMDAVQASSYRANVEANGGCCRDLMEELDEMLRENNPFAAIYKKMRQVLEEEYLKAEAENRPHQFVGMFISSDRKNLDQRRYNNPTTDDIAIIFKSVNGEPPVDRDIRGHLLIPSRGRKFIQINPQKPMCDPMTYPLLFPNGEDGWHSNMPYTTTTRKEREGATAMDVDEGDEQQVLDEEEEPDAEEEIEGDDDNDPHSLNRGSGKRKRVTQCEFYSYLISIRNYFNQVLAGGPLTQQWIVDSYVKI
ncbi:uncharacterized protein LOC124327698 [Daphnia pulicaria]|uniref:uncharacterized protein LOC124327698 n=1 Tax=Daphnia pulicaria TaxID=35523 RepID=UPI001EE9CC47|nr:uncharacterized protein LOC124327698 [Daphnia pulicaria]